MQVGPAFGNRFSPAFLQGLTAWLDHFGPAATTSSPQANSKASPLQMAADPGGAALATDSAHGSVAASAAAFQSPEPGAVSSMSRVLHKEGSVKSAVSTLESPAQSASPCRAWWPDVAAAPTGSTTPSQASHADTATDSVQPAEPVGNTDLQESLQSETAASAAEIVMRHTAESIHGIESLQHTADGPAMVHLAVQAADRGEGIAKGPLPGSVSVVLPEQAQAQGAESQAAPAEEPVSSEVSAIRTDQLSLPFKDALTASPVPKTTASAPSDASSSGSVSTGLAPTTANPSLQFQPSGVQAAEEGTLPESLVFQTSTSAVQQGSSAESQQASLTLHPRIEAIPSSIQPDPPGDDWLDALRQFSPAPPESGPHPSAENTKQDGRYHQHPALRNLQADPSPGFQFSCAIPGGSSPETPRASGGPPASIPDMPTSPASSSRSPGQPRAPGGQAASQGSHQPRPVQLSLRLEHLRLTDGDVGQLADWAEAQGGRAEIVKLWMFDNSISDAGAFHVGRMLHEGMQEVGPQILGHWYLVFESLHCTIPTLLPFAQGLPRFSGRPGRTCSGAPQAHKPMQYTLSIHVWPLARCRVGLSKPA